MWMNRDVHGYSLWQFNILRSGKASISRSSIEPSIDRYIAIENGHKHSEFFMKNGGSFYGYVTVYQTVNPTKSHRKPSLSHIVYLFTPSYTHHWSFPEISSFSIIFPVETNAMFENGTSEIVMAIGTISGYQGDFRKIGRPSGVIKYGVLEHGTQKQVIFP